MSISTRISMILHSHNLTNSAFADKLGIQRSNVSHVISGRNKPSLDFLEKIVEQFPRVDAHWLLTGQMKSSNSSAIIHEQSLKSKVEDEDNEIIVEKSKLSDSAIELNQVLLVYSNGTFKSLNPKDFNLQ